MFTGIIQTVGQIERVSRLGEDVKLNISCIGLDMQDVKTGDSIAVNGVCLTAVNFSDAHFEAHVSKETLSVTVGLDKPHAVNLEKALRLSDRLGGHLVSGHVDGVGEVVLFEQLGDCWKLDIRAPHVISKYIAVKGSICVNGVSLTINTIAADVFSINLIPHTLENTTLQFLKIGSFVNLEVDQIARYVERMALWAEENDKNTGITQRDD
ncbi:riboflavin synthase [Methylotenera sp.]|uniref:riboflavin synthase n=1 Tax=Methylotenera sp. TaxID=2051956 RepID=UPI0027309EB7|nr:riboflavin synthase [Methylotenera sp.]MDP2070387.1 riboflavin synthase [Methylotenera sp.]MDP2230482.1 riboflavin synthase [Methylotenera sp.]MDP3005690.1 riboflavin synthase [Methylotenera sp.]MDP3140049.1 riboflavin synthase [Methylotenera sp.]